MDELSLHSSNRTPKHVKKRNSLAEMILDSPILRQKDAAENLKSKFDLAQIDHKHQLDMQKL
jgi:hypothetical protein